LCYCEDLAADRREHARFHRRRRHATDALGYVPASYCAQEEAKRAGWARVLHNENVQARLAGADIILRAWFDRSLEAAIRGGYWKQHPPLERFVRMMTFGCFDIELCGAIRKKYGAAIGDELAPGASYWFPPDSSDRHDQWRAYRRWMREEVTPR
jgi:hypothetical protein